MAQKRFPKVFTPKRNSMWVSKTTNESVKREVAFSGPALSLLKKNPRILKDFLRAKRFSLRVNRKAKIGEVLVENLTGNVAGETGSGFYKVTIKGRSFFVKEYKFGRTGKHFVPEWDLPSAQRKAFNRARLFLKRHKQKYPEFIVANFHLSFTGRSSALFVTDFHDLISARNYLMPSSEKNVHMRARIDTLAGELEKLGISDIINNTFYSPSLKKFVLVDLRNTKDNKIKLPSTSIK